jgi:hypothetical protein
MSEISEKDIVLFEPSKRDMLIDYPELKQYDVFSRISASDMKFSWYVANRTSPIIREPKEKRFKMACELAYDERKLRVNDRVKKMYNEMDIPEDIVEACQVMASFNPSFRMRAKLLTEHSFSMLQSLVFLSKQELATMDLDDKKKYADLIVKANSALGDMILNMETGYGVKVKKEKSKKWEMKAHVSDIIDSAEPTTGE